MSFRILFFPRRRMIHAEEGTTLLEAGIQAKAGIPHKCGGHGSCGTCRIRLRSHSSVNPPTRIEHLKLTDSQLQSGFRLSCQVQISGDLEVEVPESPLARVVRLQLAELHRNHEGEQE